MSKTWISSRNNAEGEYPELLPGKTIFKVDGWLYTGRHSGRGVELTPLTHEEREYLNQRGALQGLGEKEKVQLVLGEDLSSFLGNDPKTIKGLDIEASQANYETEVRKALASRFPEFEVEFNWGGAGNVLSLYYQDPKAYEYLQDDLGQIEGDVYNNGAFWATK